MGTILHDFSGGFGGSFGESGSFKTYEQPFPANGEYITAIQVVLKEETPNGIVRISLKSGAGELLSESPLIDVGGQAWYLFTLPNPIPTVKNQSFVIVLDGYQNEGATGSVLPGLSSYGPYYTWHSADGINFTESTAKLAIQVETKTYAKTNFNNGAAPALSAEELNKMGQGIEEAHIEADKAQTVEGFYTGDGQTTRFINLGFKPKKIEIHPFSYSLISDTGRPIELSSISGSYEQDLNIYGGLFFDGDLPATRYRESATPQTIEMWPVVMDVGGFWVKNQSVSHADSSRSYFIHAKTNFTTILYKYIAYKD